MTYAEKLQDPRWQKKRLEILQRDKFTCKLCNDTKTSLHIHHEKYHGKKPWNTPNDFLITYCKICHLLVTELGDDFTVHKVIKGGNENGFIYLKCLAFHQKKEFLGLFKYQIKTNNMHYLTLIPSFEYKSIVDIINYSKEFLNGK